MSGLRKSMESPQEGAEIMTASRAALKAGDNETVIEKVRNYQGAQAPIDSRYNTATGNDVDAKLREDCAPAIRASLEKIGILLAPSENPLMDESVADFVKEMDLRFKEKTN